MQVIDNTKALSKTLAKRLALIKQQIFVLTVEYKVSDLQWCHWVLQNLIDVDLHYLELVKCCLKSIFIANCDNFRVLEVYIGKFFSFKFENLLSHIEIGFYAAKSYCKLGTTI